MWRIKRSSTRGSTRSSKAHDLVGVADFGPQCCEMLTSAGVLPRAPILVARSMRISVLRKRRLSEVSADAASTFGRVRFDPYATGANWYEDVLALAGHLAQGPLDAALSQLVAIRVSQITGCAFCLGLHTSWARQVGVDQAKLDRLAGWREAPEFDRRERAALGLAEEMTRVGDGRRVDGATWLGAREQFEDDELAALLYLVGLINVWNRINIAVELPSDHVLLKGHPRASGN
jgi:AhpD family alkylhydroperoxidase